MHKHLFWSKKGEGPNWAVVMIIFSLIMLIVLLIIIGQGRGYLQKALDKIMDIFRFGG